MPRRAAWSRAETRTRLAGATPPGRPPRDAEQGTHPHEPAPTSAGGRRAAAPQANDEEGRYTARTVGKPIPNQHLERTREVLPEVASQVASASAATAPPLAI